jgi:hypothetical protein
LPTAVAHAKNSQLPALLETRPVSLHLKQQPWDIAGVLLPGCSAGSNALVLVWSKTVSVGTAQVPSQGVAQFKGPVIAGSICIHYVVTRPHPSTYQRWFTHALRTVTFHISHQRWLLVRVILYSMYTYTYSSTYCLQHMPPWRH